MNQETVQKITMGIAIFIAMTLLVSNCSQKKREQKILQAVQRIDTTLMILSKKESITEQQLRDVVKDESLETMYKFLIYEDDLDRGKTSLSTIRDNVDKLKSE